MNRLFTTAFFTALTCLVFGQNLQPDFSKIDQSLVEKTAGGKAVPFLVLLPQQADLSSARQLKTKDAKAAFVFNKLRETAHVTQAGLSAFLSQKNAKHEGIFIVNAIKVEGDFALVAELSQRPDVAQIMDNPTMRNAEPVENYEEVVTERVLVEWGIDMINANDVWALGYRGEGVTIGGQDTGYDWTHPALKSKYRGYDATTGIADHNYNWHDAIHSISPLASDSINPCGLDSPFPCDDGDHGTHTMGTMLGADADNEIGVAPASNWCACRNMERGNGSPFTYLECFQWFMAPTDLNNQNPDPSKSPHVINNSWYCSQGEGCNASNNFVMEQAVNNLRMAGTVVVVSAGNSGSGCGSVSNPPAMFENSFSVGATAINDTISGYSSRGPVVVDGSNRLKPNVSAPGSGIRSTVTGGGYGIKSGTSMAGPHVAGLVALVISANPELAGQVELIEDLIEETAVPKTTEQNCGDIPGTQVPNHTYGYGRVDALAAVEAAVALIEPNSVAEVKPLVAKVSPNPVSQRLQVEVKNAQGSLRFELFDTNGRRLTQRQWDGAGQSSVFVDFMEMPSGIYFYRILNGESLVKGKVVKQ